MGSLEYDLRHGLKNLDQMLRTVRLRLSSRSASLTRQLLEKYAMPPGQDWGPGPWLVVDLHTTRPDGQQGRRSYALIAYFLRAGWRWSPTAALSATSTASSNAPCSNTR